MFWDTHMHTLFSGDSDASVDSMIEKAIELGLPGICITDHLDWDYREEPGLFDLDLPAYADMVHGLQERYGDRLAIRFGIELGLQPHLAERHAQLLKSYDFDFVIGSSHVVHGVDPYYPNYYEGRSEEQCYQEYFESILENLAAFDDFDTYGHIDYVVRYGPTRNENYSYDKYREVLDEILKQLIARGKGLEVNTAGFKYGLGHPNPTEEIISRYIELGGELITIGADGHKPEHIAYDFHKLPELLKSCGVKQYAVFKNRKPEFIRI